MEGGSPQVGRESTQGRESTHGGRESPSGEGVHPREGVHPWREGVHPREGVPKRGGSPPKGGSPPMREGVRESTQGRESPSGEGVHPREGVPKWRGSPLVRKGVHSREGVHLRGSSFVCELGCGPKLWDQSWSRGGRSPEAYMRGVVSPQVGRESPSKHQREFSSFGTPPNGNGHNFLVWCPFGEF